MYVQPCFVWLDLEMTGLEPEDCAIIELAMIITGPDLKPLAEYERIIWQPDAVLSRMEPIVREMHTRNGLTDRVRKSPHSLRVVEREVVSLLADHCGVGEGLLAGSSIHTDRLFLRRHMPMFDRYLHYRMVDVSSLKLLTRAWFPGGPEFRKSAQEHTALADIRASLGELAFYKEHFFRPHPV